MFKSGLETGEDWQENGWQKNGFDEGFAVVEPLLSHRKVARVFNLCGSE